MNQLTEAEPLERLHDWFGNVENKHIAILGIAFKLTNDVWESTAVDWGLALKQAGANVRFYDPVAPEFVGADGETVTVMADVYAVLRGVDAAIVVTEWPDIIHLNWRLVRRLMRQPYIYDARNVLDPITLLREGFIYGNLMN